MSRDIIIAIDGLAGSGKSTLAKQLAAALNYHYVDSGAFYRAVTLFFLDHGIDWERKESLTTALKYIHLDFLNNPDHNGWKTFLNGEDVGERIRSMKVSGAVSEVSTLPEVRTFLVDKLREYGKHKKVVMDGRDIGTVVFPGAELKVYLVAEEKIRIERRLREFKEKGMNVTEDQISQNLSGRDLLDSTRATAPLKKADDAIVLDNTKLTLQEQFDVILKLARERIGD